MKTLLITSTLVLLVAGCNAAPQGANLDEYRRLNDEIALSVTQHRTNADDTTTAEECRAEAERYDSDVRPKVQRMREISGDLDGCHGGGGMQGGQGMHGGEMRGMCNSMMGEIDSYQSTSCDSTDIEENRTVRERHCTMMLDYTQQSDSHTGMMGGDCSM